MRITLRIMHLDQAVAQRECDDIMIGADRPAHAWLMAQMAHFDRADPHRSRGETIRKSG